MNIQRVKQGAKITYYSGFYLILAGIYLILFIERNMRANFDSINQLWGFFTKFNTEIANIFILYNILAGILLITIGIVIIYLSDFIYKRKDKMTWVILFLIGIITWVSLIIISILLNNLILIIGSLIGWLLFIAGMLLPIRYYLEKTYKEY